MTLLAISSVAFFSTLWKVKIFFVLLLLLSLLFFFFSSLLKGGRQLRDYKG